MRFYYLFDYLPGFGLPPELADVPSRHVSGWKTDFHSYPQSCLRFFSHFGILFKATDPFYNPSTDRFKCLKCFLAHHTSFPISSIAFLFCLRSAPRVRQPMCLLWPCTSLARVRKQALKPVLWFSHQVIHPSFVGWITAFKMSPKLTVFFGKDF